VRAHAQQANAERKVLQRRGKLTGKQAITAAQLYGPHQHKPVLEAERILMMGLASENVATIAMLLDTLPPPSTDRVNRLYRQLGEILIIIAAQQAECSFWHRAGGSTSSLVHPRVD
jgi:hypothetical protein